MNKNLRIEGKELTNELNKQFVSFFKNAFSVARGIKGYRFAFFKHVIWQRKAARLRMSCESEGIHVPPFLIHSVTQKCNLNCKGCYAKELHINHHNELSTEKLESVIDEAQELGVSVVMLAGGEPFTREDILDITAKHKRIVFPIFTNGLLITDKMSRNISESKNVFPIISIEGDEQKTDTRRGEGVYSKVVRVFKRLKENKVLFGASVTLTRDNFEDVVNESFVSDLKEQGAKIIFYIEYIPCSDNTDELVPTSEQRKKLAEKLEEFRKSIGILFVAFPGDEEMFGGCLAAGRGFVHIGSSGRVEPCPFSPFSDSDLNNMSLTEALQSEFLRKIKDNHDKLQEHSGGCALWENREWVEKTLNKEL